MVRTSEAKTYRRVPGDIDEVRHITDLILNDVKARLAQLVSEEKYDEIHRLMEYRDKWQGMLADLVEEQADDSAPPIDRGIGARIVADAASAATAKTVVPPAKKAQGGEAKAPADTTK